MTRRYPPLPLPVNVAWFSPGHVRGMTAQRVRSKDHVVRLEPFLGKAPVRPVIRRAAGRETRVQAGAQAAFLAGLATTAAADSNRTEIRFDTPDSSCVMP